MTSRAHLELADPLAGAFAALPLLSTTTVDLAGLPDRLARLLVRLDAFLAAEGLLA